MTTQTRDFAHVYRPGADNGTTLLMLHGTGGDESAMLPLAEAIAPSAGVLSPRGKVLEGSAPRFFRRLAEGVFDLEDLRLRTHELAGWIAAAAAEYGIAPGSLTAVGYSNGANIAASVLLLRPEAFKRAILLRPMLPLEPETAPDLSAAKVLVAAGAYDPLVPSRETQRLIDALKRHGADVTVKMQPADHRLTSADVAAAQAWLAGA